ACPSSVAYVRLGKVACPRAGIVKPAAATRPIRVERIGYLPMGNAGSSPTLPMLPRESPKKAPRPSRSQDEVLVQKGAIWRRPSPPRGSRNNGPVRFLPHLQMRHRPGMSAENSVRSAVFLWDPLGRQGLRRLPGHLSAWAGPPPG